MSRFRITIRGEQPPVELRGFVDSPEAVMGMSEAVRPWGVLIASLAPDDYSPFGPTARTKIVPLPGDAAWAAKGIPHEERERAYIAMRWAESRRSGPFTEPNDADEVIWAIESLESHVRDLDRAQHDLRMAQNRLRRAVDKVLPNKAVTPP